jgi:hypothetical protein
MITEAQSNAFQAMLGDMNIDDIADGLMVQFGAAGIEDLIRRLNEAAD